jgi:hypothetical protein
MRRIMALLGHFQRFLAFPKPCWQPQHVSGLYSAGAGSSTLPRTTPRSSPYKDQKTDDLLELHTHCDQKTGSGIALATALGASKEFW